MKPQQAFEIIEKGRDKMPSFINLTQAQREAVVAYLFNQKKRKLTRPVDEKHKGKRKRAMLK